MDYLSNKNYVKPNFLISAKYKSSLLANKIIAIALADLKEATDSKDGILVSEIKAAELRKMLGYSPSDRNFYKKMANVSDELTGKNIGMTDPENHSFVYLSVITTAVYNKGTLTLEWNRHITKYLKVIKKNFTKLNLGVMLSFDNVYTFRLYEILKANCYKNSPFQVAQNEYQITYDLPELRFLFGIANAELDSVKKVLSKSLNPDYEKAYEKSPEKIHLEWRDFKRKVLDPAVKGIQAANLDVSYTTIRTGLGGKTDKIVFKVVDKKNTDNITGIIDEKREAPVIDIDDFIDKMVDIIPFRIKTKDMKAIAAAAEYDIEKIKEAVDIADTNLNNIENVTGFLIAAIKNGWDRNTYNKCNKKWDFGMKADYGDMDELEALLLNDAYDGIEKQMSIKDLIKEA